MGILDPNRACHLCNSACIDCQVGFRFGGHRPIVIFKSHPHFGCCIRGQSTLDFDLDMHDRDITRNLGCSDIDSVLRNSQVAGIAEPDLAIDAGAGIPTAILARIIHADSQHVGAVSQVRSQVKGERSVTVWMIAQKNSVDPYLAIHVNAFESNLDLTVCRIERSGKCFAIPADPSYGPTRSTLSLTCITIERTGVQRICCLGPHRITPVALHTGQVFDAPVMRNVDQAPACVNKAMSLGTLHISSMESPSIRELLQAH